MRTASARRWRSSLHLAGGILALVLVFWSVRGGRGASSPSSEAYLPLVSNGLPPLLLGVYSDSYVGNAEGISRLQALDAWTGKRHSLVGVFIDLEDPNPTYNIPHQMEALWAAGYTPVVNLTIGTMGASRSAADLANGVLDAAVHAWAQAFAAWAAQGNGRFALLAPLPEMNIHANSYGGDPGAFRVAYQRLQTLFADQGVPATAVRWVFAPNGWTASGDPPMRDYYPGDPVVDLVGFSAYNWGYCPNADWFAWDTPEAVYAPIDDLRAVAPDKPLLVMQTATTAYVSQGVTQTAAKNAWLVSAYEYLVARLDVDGVLYFNIDKECDWAVYTPTMQYNGYLQAAAQKRIGYQSPIQVADRFP